MNLPLNIPDYEHSGSDDGTGSNSNPELSVSGETATQGGGGNGGSFWSTTTYPDTSTTTTTTTTTAAGADCWEVEGPGIKVVLIR